MTSVEIAPQVPNALEGVNPDRGLGVMNWLRNTRPGQLLANVSMSAAVILPGGTAVGAALAEAPSAMAADNEPALIDSQRQECIDAILDGPTIQKHPVMRHAGIRANDPTHYKIQSLTGQFEYPSLTEICPPELNILRLSLGQVWMQRRDNRNAWMQVSGNGYPGYRGNNESGSTLDFGAYQEAPESVINMCNDKGRFQKVKIVLTDYAKIPKTQTIIEKATHTIPVPVKGSCKEARHSKQVADKFEHSRPHYLGSATLSEVPETSSTDTESAPTDSGALEQACINAGLVMPKIRKAYVVHPGRKPYEKNSSEVGPVQTTFVRARYNNEMPEFCVDDYRRIGLAKIQKQVGNKWRTVSAYSEWLYTRNTSGPVQLSHAEIGEGNIPDWIYLKPGEKERLVLTNRVKDLNSGKIIDSQTKTQPVARRGR